MAEGTKTYEGLAVPLFGESEIKQQTAATDIITLTGAASMSGDFLVCQSSTGTESFVVDKDGDITGASLDVTGQVEAATLAVTGIGTFDYPARAAGVKTYTVAGLTANDVVVISPREATDGVIVVDKVAISTLQVRTASSEAANFEFNYLVIAKT
jgi:hypothetical protein